MMMFKYILSLIVGCLIVNIGSININGARRGANRASVVKQFDLKKTWMWCLSRKPTVTVNEGDWKREWPWEVFLCQKRSNSAGVGILFSRAFSPPSVMVLDIMSGHILRVNALYENVKVLFICVHAPVLAAARMNFLNVLCDIVCDCADDY